MTAVSLPRYATRRDRDGWHVVDTKTGATFETFPATAAGAELAAAVATAKNRSGSKTGRQVASPLRDWRKTHRLSQQKLADLLGVRWLTVQRWEAGTCGVPPYLHLALERLEQLHVH